MAPTTASTCPGSTWRGWSRRRTGARRYRAGSGERAAPATRWPGDTRTVINLNGATADLLDTLPGVGPTLPDGSSSGASSTAASSSVDELLEVSGIGPKTLAELAPLVTV